MRQLLSVVALGGIIIFSKFNSYANSIENIEENNNTSKIESEIVSSKNSHQLNKKSKSTSLDYYVNQSREFQFADIEIDNQIEVSNSFDIESEYEINEDSAQYYYDKANQLLDLVKSENRFIDKLDSDAIISLPVGIRTELGGLEYIILIEEVIFRPDGAFFNALMSFESPKGKLAFRGRDIPFSFSGGLEGDVFLELVTPVPIPFGDGIDMVIKADGSSYVVWDCYGFKSMGISADIIFSEDLIVPENTNGEIIKGRNVSCSFTAEMTDWNDLIVNISLPAFQVTGVEGVGFLIENAVFDFSDHNNFSGMKFPEAYTSTYFVPGNKNLWRGFYLGHAEIRLPKEFNSGSTRTSFIAYDLLIDDQGFSGVLIAENIISLEKGKMGNWAFSLDKIGVELVANQLTKAGFEGKVQVPLLSEDNPLEYTALIDMGGEYAFTISTTKDVKMDVWSADVNLAQTSFIEVAIEDNEFKPRAVLNGNASIKISDNGVELADIGFEALEIASTKPYVKVGAFSFGSEAVQQATAGFPVSVENIGFNQVSDTKIGISFNIILNLVGEGDGGFGAECGLMIVGEMSESSGIQSWKYSYLELTKIAVDIDGGAYSVSGSLEFFKNDLYYGNGFKGDATIEIAGMIEIEGMALFGKVDGYRYWYADAMATFKSGIPIGAFALNKFGGGVFHHMRQLDFGEEFGGTLGKTKSNVIYRPDKKVLIGIKASVGLILINAETVFNGDATLEIVFNHGGGLRTIDFQGNANFITPELLGAAQQLVKLQGAIDLMKEDKTPERTTNSSLSAEIRINMNFPAKTLHANLKVYVNVAGGIIKGIGPGDLAGESVMHFSPGEWYIHVGSPDNPVGLEVLSMIRLESYFMVGDNIPGSPPPPAEVSRILGGIDLDYMGAENDLASGRGIAFGARITMDTGDLTFLIFYARFTAGLGFDLMLKDYGNITCAGRSGELGINGWYANGQAFAYFSGKVGIIVKIFGKTKKYEIIDLGMAAVLQAKLPDPFWMRGIVGGYYSLLGGMIKGDCKFEVVIGEECEFVGEGSVLEGIEVISELTPASGQSDIDVFNSPQAVFNMEIDKVFEMVDLDGKTKAFRIKLDHFKIMKSGSEIDVNYKWNADHTVIALQPTDILPGESSIKAMAQISFEERDRSVWKPVKLDNKVITESMEITFTTGKAPDYIPLHNVKYCYPIINHYNFYSKEYSKGYVQLKQGQDYLFEANADFNTKGRYTSYDGTETLFDIVYKQNNEIEYNIPSGLKINSVYTFDIVNVPLRKISVDKNISKRSRLVELGDESKKQSITIATREAEGSIKNLKVKLIFTSHFRASYYATLKEKLDDMFISTGFRRNIHSDIHELGVTLFGKELFEKYETHWTTEISPLVQFKAVLTDDYYKNNIDGLIYKPYNSQSAIKIDWRNPNFDIGYPPVKALYIRQIPFNKTLTEGEINGGYSLGTATEGAFVYNLIWFYAKDFFDLQQKAAVKIYQGSNISWYSTLMNSTFPEVKSGKYQFDIKYVVPGRNEVSSKYRVNIDNKL
ncbi:MAG: hypothetical protein KOO66_03465 [Bacteroidales bacterium]|nr:hypothetical protein [Bacteroidales bacterium]